MTPSIPTTTLNRFQAFAANHGPLESPLAISILETFFTRSISRFYDHSQEGTLQDWVERQFKIQAADILACLELAAQWSADPLKAAEGQLRADLEAKTTLEAIAKKRDDDATLEAAVKAKAESFLSQLKKSASAIA